MPVDASRTDTPFGASPGRVAALVVAAGLFFALTSPFNAVVYLPFAGRWVYWSGLIALVAITHLVVWRIAGQRQPAWRLALLVSVLSTPLVMVAILVVQQALLRPVALVFWPSLAASIWVINAALAALAAYFSTARPARAAAPLSGEEAGRPDPLEGLRQRLPAAVREASILALNAQDHYLNVILADGQHLIHMRLGDALAMLAGHDGLQVHRSWWVAREAVEAIDRRGRRVEITLRDGQTVPVSRAGAARLREAGWL